MFDSMFFTIIQFFEKAGFFFVPIFSLFVLLNMKSLKPGATRILFLLFTSITLIVYLIIGTGSSRYLLIPLILWGILAGAGEEFFCIWLHKIPFVKRISANVLIILVATVIAFICMLRVYFRDSNAVVSIFAEKIMKQKKEKSSIYYVDFRNASKIDYIFSGFSHMDLRFFENWEDAILHFINHQYEDRDFFFCVEFPKEYYVEDFKKWFRSSYYVFPFDVLREYCYRGKRYLLLKFNCETATREEVRKYTPVFDPSVKRIEFQDWSEDWSRTSIANILATKQPTIPSGFFYSPFLRFIDKWVFKKEKGEEVTSVTEITYCNDLAWPRERRSFQLSSLKMPNQETTVSAMVPTVENSVLLSKEKPLILVPPYVLVPESFPELHLSGAVPAYQNAKACITFTGDKECVSVTNNNKTVSVCISEQATGQSTSADLHIQWLEKKAVNPNKAMSILLIEDAKYTILKLSEELVPYFGKQSSFDRISLVDGVQPPLALLKDNELPDKKFQAVVLNVLWDPIYRPWSIPVQSGPVLDKLLEDSIRKLQKKYPDAPCFVILPPAPIAEASFYTSYCNSPQLSKLSHYRICDAVQRWFTRSKPANVYMIPLYFAVNSEKDYHVHLRVDGFKAYSGYAFNPDVRQRFAEIISSSILYFIGESQKTTKNCGEASTTL